MAQDIELLGATYPDVPAVQLPKSGGGTALFTDTSDTSADESDVVSGEVFYTSSGTRSVGTATYAGSQSAGGNANATNAILFGQVDSTSTSTAFTATVPGLTELVSGTCVMLKNGVVTSAEGFTININNLGAKPSYTNMAAATRDTTIFNVNYTMMMVYDEDRGDNGGWICYRGYDANTNTIGYQLRTNSSTLPAQAKFYRYRILFTSADGKKWVPANTSSSTNATASRTVNQTKIDPFGPIVYYGTTTAIEANANVTAAQLWQQYTMTLGYSFNRTGAALVLTYPAPVYVKCTPQVDGSAIIDSTTPYVQALPSTKDGSIYIFLGIAYSATAVEMRAEHPVYWHDGSRIRLWTGYDDVADIMSDIEGSYVSYGSLQSAYNDISHMSIYPADATAQAVMQSMTSSTPTIMVPSDIVNIQFLMLGLNDNMHLVWVYNSRVELAPVRASIDMSGNTPVVTLYARGYESMASGIMGVDDSWAVAANPADADGVSY